MNSIVLGTNYKAAQQLKTISDNVYLMLDKSFINDRKFVEIKNFTIINSNINVSNYKGIIPRAIEIRKWIIEYDLDIIYSNRKWDMVAAKLAKIFSRKKVILLATNHDSYSWQDKNKVRLMYQLIKHTTDGYIALASFVYDKLLSLGLNKKRIALIPNTIEYENWKRKIDYNINNTFKIVYVAHVYPGKNQDSIIDILIRLSEYNIVVDCYGNYEDNMDYVNIINNKITKYGLEGKLRLCGNIDNALLRNKLCEYDAYICPSKMEMSPVNILEAKASGLPIIATKVGGIIDIIDDGKDGYLYELGDHDKAASIIKTLISSELIRKKIGDRAFASVSSCYTYQNAGQKILNLINNI